MHPISFCQSSFHSSSLSRVADRHTRFGTMGTASNEDSRFRNIEFHVASVQGSIHPAKKMSYQTVPLPSCPNLTHGCCMCTKELLARFHSAMLGGHRRMDAKIGDPYAETLECPEVGPCHLILTWKELEAHWAGPREVSGFS